MFISLNLKYRLKIDTAFQVVQIPHLTWRFVQRRVIEEIYFTCQFIRWKITSAALEWTQTDSSVSWERCCQISQSVLLSVCEAGSDTCIVLTIKKTKRALNIGHTTKLLQLSGQAASLYYMLQPWLGQHLKFGLQPPANSLLVFVTLWLNTSAAASTLL